MSQLQMRNLGLLVYFLFKLLQCLDFLFIHARLEQKDTDPLIVANDVLALKQCITSQRWMKLLTANSQRSI